MRARTHSQVRTHARPHARTHNAPTHLPLFFLVHCDGVGEVEEATEFGEDDVVHAEGRRQAELAPEVDVDDDDVEQRRQQQLALGQHQEDT